MNSSPRTIICLPTEGHNHDKWMEEGEDLLEEPGQLFSSRRAHSFKHRVPSWLLFDEGPISAESMDSRGLASFFFFFFFLNGVLYINGHSIIH